MYFGDMFKFKLVYHQRVTQPILCWRKFSKTYIPQGALNKIFSGNTLDPHCRRGDPLRTTPARLLYNRTDRRSSVRPVSPHRSTPLYASNIWKVHVETLYKYRNLNKLWENDKWKSLLVRFLYSFHHFFGPWKCTKTHLQQCGIQKCGIQKIFRG